MARPPLRTVLPAVITLAALAAGNARLPGQAPAEKPFAKVLYQPALARYFAPPRPDLGFPTSLFVQEYWASNLVHHAAYTDLEQADDDKQAWKDPRVKYVLLLTGGRPASEKTVGNGKHAVVVQPVGYTLSWRADKGPEVLLTGKLQPQLRVNVEAPEKGNGLFNAVLGDIGSQFTRKVIPLKPRAAKPGVTEAPYVLPVKSKGDEVFAELPVKNPFPIDLGMVLGAGTVRYRNGSTQVLKADSHEYTLVPAGADRPVKIAIPQKGGTDLAGAKLELFAPGWFVNDPTLRRAGETTKAK